MAQKIDQFPSLSALLREGLGDALAPDAQTLLDMVTDDIRFEFPFALPDGPKIIEGKQAFADHLPKVADLFTFESMKLDRAFLSADRRNAVVEFSVKAHATGSAARYDQDYVSVIDLREGLISRYRDYWNPLIVLSATGGVDALDAVLKGEQADG